jgi:hypothetical protein
MKAKFIVSLCVLTFALVAQAGDAKATKENKEASSCCANKATAKADADKASGKSCGSSCCSEKPVKQALLSPKAAAEKAR